MTSSAVLISEQSQNYPYSLMSKNFSSAVGKLSLKMHAAWIACVKNLINLKQRGSELIFYHTQMLAWAHMPICYSIFKGVLGFSMPCILGFQCIYILPSHALYIYRTQLKSAENLWSQLLDETHKMSQMRATFAEVLASEITARIEVMTDDVHFLTKKVSGKFLIL